MTAGEPYGRHTRSERLARLADPSAPGCTRASAASEGMDTANLPYAWRTMEPLHGRVEPQAEALAHALTEALQELETQRQQVGLPKVFLSLPPLRIAGDRRGRRRLLLVCSSLNVAPTGAGGRR